MEASGQSQRRRHPRRSAILVLRADTKTNFPSHGLLLPFKADHQRVTGQQMLLCNCFISPGNDAEEQVTSPSKEKVLDALGEAASKLRGELGESLTTVQKFDVPLAEATTSSLEALKAYSLSQKELNEKSAAASLPYAQRAIELDPNFALIQIHCWEFHGRSFIDTKPLSTNR